MLQRAHLLAFLLFLIAGCQATALTATIAQTALEPYSFHFDGEAKGILAINSRFCVVDAEVIVKLTYRGPDNDVLGAPIVIRWTKEIKRGPGLRAYEAVFGSNGKFIEIRPVSVERAKASMPWLVLPPPPT